MSCLPTGPALCSLNRRTVEMHSEDHNGERGEEVWPAAVWPTSEKDNMADSPHHGSLEASPVAVSSPVAASPVSPYTGLYTVVFRLVCDSQLPPRGPANYEGHSSMEFNRSSAFTPAPSTAPTTAASAPAPDYGGFPSVGPTYVPYPQQAYTKRDSAYSDDSVVTACHQHGGCSGMVYGSPEQHPRDWPGYPSAAGQMNRADYTRHTQQQQQGCCGVVPVDASSPSHHHHHRAAGGDGVYLPAGFFTSTPLSHHRGMQFVHTPGHPHGTACTTHFAPYGATPLPAGYPAASVASPQQHMGYACYGSAAERPSFYMSTAPVGGSSSPDASPVAAMIEKVSEEELRSAMPEQYLD
ncbi:hypothetical protein FOZ60_017633 [Perkinsus olseni]|uniref:Uncharacterized protein n=1 Tax=Perkinsus olseni TaxID=32597 RepID=A0A7J6NAE1_PEROL|nr:hypothetical protein FOZ60_017633 [Perkinsus olseni]